MDIVFAIASPMQVVNAIEYIEQELGEITGNVYWFVLTPGASQRKIIVNLIQENYKGHHIVTPPFLNSKNALLKLSLNAINRAYVNVKALRIKKISKLVLGHYGSPIIRSFAKYGKKAQIVILDDGIFTLNVPALRKKELATGQITYYGGKINKVIARIWGEQILKRPLSFFTYFDIQIPEGDTYILNRQSWLKEKVRHKKQQNTVFFIGMNLSENGIMSEEHYLSALENAFATTGKTNAIEYIAKYTESADKLEKIKSRFSAYDLTIVRPKYPIEYYIAQIDFKPSEIATFYTSALHNMMNIYGPGVKYTAFRLPESQLVSREKKMIDKSYESIAKNAVFAQCGTLVSLPD